MKNPIPELAKKCVYKVMHILRKLYHKCRSRRLTNTTPTIISSDCFGGIASHDLGLKFRSPTINLFFSHEDFILFVQDLRGYLDAELIHVSDPSVPYPVGELEYNGKTIRVNFMHYQSFEEAREKWNQRKQRVDYSNLFVIQLVSSATEEKINAFDALPYPHKMLITDRNLTNSRNVYTHEIFRKEDYHPGQILEYKSVFSVKRHMDEIDYIGFLNQTD